MRIALFGLTTLALVCAAGAGQEAKKKDEKPPEMGSVTKEVTEVAGKDLDQWIKEIAAKDPSKRALAMRMVTRFGPKKAQMAVPAIYKELKKHKHPVPIDMGVRIDGCIALSTILTGVKDPDLKQVADAVAIIGAFCKDDQVLVKARAAQSLARFGSMARYGTKGLESVNDLVAVALEPSGWEARQAGLQCLIELTRLDPDPADSVLRAFYKGLKDNAMQVRITSAQLLPQFQEIRPNHIKYPQLIYNLEYAAKDVEPQVQIWAHMALMKIKLDPKKPAVSPEHLAPITKLLKNRDPIVKMLALQCLAQIGELAHSEWQRVVPLLVACIGTLSCLEAVEAVPVLEELSEDPLVSVAVKQAARNAIEVLKYGNKRRVTPTNKAVGTK
jgi:hypothetical protein